MAAVALFAPPPVTCPETSRGPHPESDLSDDGSDRDWPERARVHRAEAVVAEQEHRALGDAHRPEVGPVDLGAVHIRFGYRLPIDLQHPVRDPHGLAAEGGHA